MLLRAPEEKRDFLRRKAEADDEGKASSSRRFSRALSRGVVGSSPGGKRQPRSRVAPPVGLEGMFEDEPQAEGAAVVAAAREALQALCQELNLDEGSAAEALDDFTAIRGNYSLEVSGGRWAAAPTLARPHPRPAPAPASRAVGAPPLPRVSEECGEGRVGVARSAHPFVLRRETEAEKRNCSRVSLCSGVP